MLASVSHLDQRKGKPPLTLRLLRGAHRGAERACRDRDVIIIGSAEDCDLVLSGDRDVHAHHCMVTVTGGALQVRALDGPVTIAGKRVSSGEPVLTQSFELIELGQAIFSLGPSWSDRWKTLDAHIAAQAAQALQNQQAEAAAEQLRETPSAIASAAANNSSPPQSVRKPPLWAIAASVACLAAIAALVFALRSGQNVPPNSRENQLTQVQQLVQSKAYTEVNARFVGERLLLEGVTADQASFDRLKARVADLPFLVDLRVQSGTSVADQVRELLKVAGVSARSEYVGNKTVHVTGHFGDGKALMLAIGQSAMQDVLPGLKVTALNEDADQALLPEPIAEPSFLHALKGLRSVCALGGECFVQIGAEGNTYFVGSELPGGGTLVEADQERIVVEFESNRYIVRILDLKLESRSPAATAVSKPINETFLTRGMQ
jgi:hypothetical protein